MTSISQFTEPFNGHQLDMNVNVAPSSSSELSKESCGIVKTTFDIKSVIFGGETVKRGEWPWLVAIYQIDAFGTAFACGGTLISNRISKSVLTAAHCVKGARKSYQLHEILLYFGHYNRLDWNESDSIRSGVSEIHIHPDYQVQSQTKDADLAILIAKEIFEFNDFIQPVCLWSTEASDLDTIGTVVGWGRDPSNRLISTYPRKMELPIVEVDECMVTNERIAAALSNRTFCASTFNGNGPCHGDSGSGLMMFHNNRWMIRGLVSSGLTNGNGGQCILTEYIIFTDITKFLPWIRQHAFR